jgi:hypothetical protein
MLSEAGEAEMVKLGEPPDNCVTPGKATVVRSPVALLVQTTTVNRVPVSVTCWVRLLLGHTAADQLFPIVS